MTKLDQIQISLKDCKYQRAQDMISQVKDTIVETFNLGQHSPELYPQLHNLLSQTNVLIDTYKLGDKSVFSQVS